MVHIYIDISAIFLRLYFEQADQFLSSEISFLLTLVFLSVGPLYADTCRHVHNEEGKDEVRSQCCQLVVELVSQEDGHDRLRQVTDCKCDLHGDAQRRSVSATHQLHHYNVNVRAVTFLHKLYVLCKHLRFASVMPLTIVSISQAER